MTRKSELEKELREPIEFHSWHRIRAQRGEAAERIKVLERSLRQTYVLLSSKGNIYDRAMQAQNIVAAALGLPKHAGNWRTDP